MSRSKGTQGRTSSNCRVAIDPELFKLLAHRAIEEGTKPNACLGEILRREFNQPASAIGKRSKMHTQA